MYCGACARDITLVRGLIARGHDVQIIPLYTPLKIEGNLALPLDDVFLGGVNAYLQQVSGIFRRMPGFMARLLDSRALLEFVSRFAISTKPSKLGAMTVSVLAGAHGRQVQEVQRLIGHLREQGPPDAFVITNSLLSGLAPALKQHFGVPVICGLQGEDHFVRSIGERHQAQAVELMQTNAESVDVFVAPGEAYAATMARFLAVPADKVRVVHAGVNIPDYAWEGDRPREPFTIGYLSAITPGKGLDVLIDAFATLITEQRRDVRLRVAGKPLDKAYWSTVQNTLAQRGIADCVEFLGEISLPQKQEFLRHCSVFVMPSRFPETRAMAAMEAMAAGVPVALPAQGVFPELLTRAPGGRLFPPEDAATLAGHLADLMDRPEEADRLGIAGAEGIAEHYSGDASTEEMMQVLRALLGSA